MKWLSLLALVALAAAVLPGCGGSGGVSKEEFQSSVGAIGDSIADSFQQLAESAPGASSLDELADQLSEVKSELEDAAADLGALEFPDDVADTKQQLTSGVEALADDVQRLIDAVNSGNLASIEDVAAEFQNLDLGSLEQIQAAIDKIEAAGYDVSGQ